MLVQVLNQTQMFPLGNNTCCFPTCVFIKCGFIYSLYAMVFKATSLVVFHPMAFNIRRNRAEHLGLLTGFRFQELISLQLARSFNVQNWRQKPKQTSPAAITALQVYSIKFQTIHFELCCVFNSVCHYRHAWNHSHQLLGKIQRVGTKENDRLSVYNNQHRCWWIMFR